jgi:hypothetical protein
LRTRCVCGASGLSMLRNCSVESRSNMICVRFRINMFCSKLPRVSRCHMWQAVQTLPNEVMDREGNTTVFEGIFAFILNRKSFALRFRLAVITCSFADAGVYANVAPGAAPLVASSWCTRWSPSISRSGRPDLTIEHS